MNVLKGRVKKEEMPGVDKSETARNKECLLVSANRRTSAGALSGLGEWLESEHVQFGDMQRNVCARIVILKTGELSPRLGSYGDLSGK
jgi:hypothetical protein